MPAVIPPHCGDPDHWDPINCPADRVNRPPLNTVAASAEGAVAAAVPDFKKAVFATNFTTNTTTNKNFTVDGVAALNRTAQANATVAPENPYQRNQFEYDARSMGFAIGILILVGAFFAYVLFADICSGKYRFKKRFRAASAAKFQGEEGLPFWNKKNKAPQQQQTATPGQQQIAPRSQSATGTVATRASGNTTTFVATSTTPTPEPPAKASSDTNGKGKSNGSEATKTMTKATTASRPSNGTASTSAPAAATSSTPARASNGRSASAVSASSPVDLTLKTSNPPRIPTPAAISALDDGKRQSNNSLGRAVLSVFAK
ncbi:hypothetical protein PGQ11_014521 [Apiospora arundinis]|uniref:Uncharacterized protein n=1 Tax=Apiospora arundinis TaxID=335852 RepID=A0ABR2HTS3_9PEZI